MLRGVAALGDMLAAVRRTAVRLIYKAVWVYRATLSPWIGGQCRYLPTCSQYMLDAVERYGPWRGVWRGVKRIGRCHPFPGGGSGHDPA